MTTIQIKGLVIPNDYADVYDYLGYESVSPDNIQQSLDEANGEDVTLEINSPGGYVDAGSEIYTDLKKYSGKVNAQIVGQACSAASWIALAADNVEMSPTAQMMIHRASTVSEGNSDNLSSDLQALNSLDESFVDLYAKRTGLDKQDIYQMMSATTWLNAKDAVDKGFADSIMFENENAENLAIVNATGEPALNKFAIDKIKNAIHKEPEKPKEEKIIKNDSQLSNKLAILFGQKEELN